MNPKPSEEIGRLPLSIDWEDWFQLCCSPFDHADALDRYPSRIEMATERALELCSDLRASATWFCLVDQARRHPECIRRIVSAGHRIALHGLTHRRAFESDRTAFRTCLIEGKAALEDLCGNTVQGFRAPEWSLRGVAEDYWKELPDMGFVYDSSRAPLNILGSTAWCRRAHRLEGRLWELPPPVLGKGPWTVPLWGWGMRLLPAPMLRSRISRLAHSDAGTPLVLHPWELDETQPGLGSGVSLGHRFAHGAGLKGLGRRLRKLWSGHRLVDIETWIASISPEEEIRRRWVPGRAEGGKLVS